MRTGIFIILILGQIYVCAEENPFNLKKEFRIIEIKEKKLFSSMQKELQKADITPIVSAIDLQNKNNSETEKKSAHTHISNKPYLLPAAYTHIPVRGIEKKHSTKRVIVIKTPYKREKKRKPKVKKYSHQWIEENIAPIDLNKEKRLKEKRLEKEYHRAVREVNQ